MAGRFLPFLAIAACGLLAALPWPAHAQSRAFDDIPRIVCAEGIEPYLPGDYYFCAANKALQAGDPRKAVAMYRESARWGDKRAMFNLGLLLVRGESVAKDEAQGLAWLALAAERPRDALHREVLAGAWQAASAETRARADALWNGMKAQYADRVALARALERYERATMQMRREGQRDPTSAKWIAGLPPAQLGGGLLAALDEAAQTTLLRPIPGRPGQVNVGAPEKVADVPPAR